MKTNKIPAQYEWVIYCQLPKLINRNTSDSGLPDFITLPLNCGVVFTKCGNGRHAVMEKTTINKKYIPFVNWGIFVPNKWGDKITVRNEDLIISESLTQNSVRLQGDCPRKETDRFIAPEKPALPTSMVGRSDGKPF